MKALNKFTTELRWAVHRDNPDEDEEDFNLDSFKLLFDVEYLSEAVRQFLLTHLVCYLHSLLYPSL